MTGFGDICSFSWLIQKFGSEFNISKNAKKSVNYNCIHYLSGIFQLIWTTCLDSISMWTLRQERNHSIIKSSYFQSNIVKIMKQGK